MSTTAAAEPFRRLLPLALAAALLFAAALWLDTRQNGFPFFYHKDEPLKVDQLITGKWNFHHPFLMLGAAEVAKKALGLPDREQTLVVLGRWVSACFAAGGVAVFALLGWRMRGWGGFWIVGLLLLTQHQVFELAHYFKEDTALFFAVALALLALHVFHRRPGWGPAIFAGAACGLCLSAKYLGAVMLIPAAIILGAAPRGKRAGAWAWFAAGFIAVTAAVNFPVLGRLDVFVHSFGREKEMVVHGERGYTGGQVALLEYLRMFVLNTTPAVWVLLIAELLAVRKRGGVFDWTLAGFPFAFMLLLSCSTKTNDRYFLPATAGFYFLAGLGVLDLPGLLAPKWEWAARLRPGPVAALALLVNVFNYPAGLASYVKAFAHDDRSEMLDWIRANIPANTVIAGEDQADLPVPWREERLAVQPLLPQRVVETKEPAELGATPAALAAQGIGCIVISESDYGKFIRKAAAAHLLPKLRREQEFYETLFRDCQPVWQRPRGTGIYLHPGLRVYRLTAVAVGR